MRSLIIPSMVLIAALFIGCGNRLPSPGPIPPGKTFEGVWDSNWGQMKLYHRGNHVHGVFKGFRTGSLSGQAEGNLFTFVWNQQAPRQWGRGFLQMTPDGERLEGEWGYQKNYRDGGRWWASRAVTESLTTEKEP